MLAVATTWDVTLCSVYPSDLRSFWTHPKPHRPRFDLAWMSYISARFSPLVEPPPSAINKRPPNGGLLMIATKDRFETANPGHLAVARDIEAALAPINALPWPPDG